MMDFFRNLRLRELPESVRLQELEELHDLSQQVFLRREMRGLTQAELAQLAGMTQAQIANLEAGSANPTNRTLTKLAHALACRVRDLYDLDDPTWDSTTVIAADWAQQAGVALWDKIAGQPSGSELEVWAFVDAPGHLRSTTSHTRFDRLPW